MQVTEGVEVRLVELVVGQRRVQPLVGVEERKPNSGRVAKNQKYNKLIKWYVIRST